MGFERYTAHSRGPCTDQWPGEQGPVHLRRAAVATKSTPEDAVYLKLSNYSTTSDCGLKTVVSQHRLGSLSCLATRAHTDCPGQPDPGRQARKRLSKANKKKVTPEKNRRGPNNKPSERNKRSSPYLTRRQQTLLTHSAPSGRAQVRTRPLSPRPAHLPVFALEPCWEARQAWPAEE